MHNIAKAFLLLAVAVLGCAFVVLCMHFGTAWPWSVVVHEDGRHTLFETVFYFEHALGELPLDILLAAAVAGSVLWFGGSPAPPRMAWQAGIGCLAVDGIIGAGAWMSAGRDLALDNLLQYHTRDGAPLLFGSHWRYHLLSQVALMSLAFVPAGLVAVPGAKAGARRCLLGAWAAFAVLTLVFGVSTESFTDPRYLGHQARELFTHALVTVPLALACIMPAAGSVVRRLRWNPRVLGSLLAALLAGGWLAGGVFLTWSQHAAQSGDWVRVVCSHFFEHVLSYAVAPLHALWFYALGAPEVRR